MDAPPIQYAKTSDGVNIAFWAIGEGPPLVVLPSALTSHVQLEWEWDVRRISYERLAQRATVIHYDHRGMGLSQHDCIDVSAEAGALDLQAVVDRLAVQRFAVLGSIITGEVTCAYAAVHPERVSHLVVTVPSLPRSYRRRLDAILPLADQDWEYFTELWARLAHGWDGDGPAQLAAWLRGSHTPSSFRSVLDTILAADFGKDSVLGAIEVPTLILHGQGAGPTTTHIARTLAGAIPGANMVAIPGWPFGETLNETGVAAILDFINAAPASPGALIPAPQIDISAVRTIVFTDVEGSTALNERLGDEGAREVMREHERLTREALGAHGGSEVKAMGDGFMAWFPSATRAVECAIALQRAFAAHNEVRDEPLMVRVGINAGEPIAEGDDLFGASVIATARVASAAHGGQILASDVVRQLLAGKGFGFEDQGEHSLKGFDEPVRLYEVRWESQA